jgi:hypothetical protein
MRSTTADGAGKPHQVFRAQAGGRLQRHKRHPVAVAQVMVAGNGHAIAQVTFAQRRFQIRNTFVAILRIVRARADGGRCLVSLGLTFCGTLVRPLVLAVDGNGHKPPGGVAG